jgi:hypothetical protein
VYGAVFIATKPRMASSFEMQELLQLARKRLELDHRRVGDRNIVLRFAVTLLGFNTMIRLFFSARGSRGKQRVRWDFGGSLVLPESPPNRGFTILTKVMPPALAVGSVLI